MIGLRRRWGPARSRPQFGRGFAVTRRAVAAPVFFEAAQDGADQLAGHVAVSPLTRREPDAQREREALQIFDPGFV